ncbi:programmed cell death protein 2-like [Leptidea sinapis]|uniref:programmed cell death protein 2-like n=1 Tax=Leptidea sinapis TaxID=189913 RepID=UPI00213E5793|nr:programmed cell death protein 2-like [Leptidea sinapis]
MAKKPGKVYLGYEDELINDKNRTLLNYTVNKIGGLPDWPPVENLKFDSKCPLCGLYRLILVQCYAPIENSAYHRTLYVFACINPNCWNLSESWACIRCQIKAESHKETTLVAMPNTDTNMSWCSGSDEWDEIDNGDSVNGNVVNLDNEVLAGIQRNSDDDESNSFEVEAVEMALGNMQMYDTHNANMSPVQGAVAAIGVPVAAAELEGGDEADLVIVDTPTAPTNNVEALLNQTSEIPADLRSRLMHGPLQFVPKYIFVEEEWMKPTYNDEKVSELFNKYRRECEIEANKKNERVGGGDEEQYEDGIPLHGDKLFHAFLTRIQNNPDQILRYSRDEPPILGAPLPQADHSPSSCKPMVCQRCQSSLICELQLVPAFAQALRILPGSVSLSHLHFLSVLIFTCSQSCWQPNDTTVQEVVVFQPEVI